MLAHVLGLALVGLQAGEAQARRRVDRLGEVDGGLSRTDAAAARADIDLDEAFEGDAVSLRGLGEVADVAGIVDADEDPGAGGQRRQPLDLLRCDHLVRDENVADAGADQRLGLADVVFFF